jgi:hypothetical protein
MTSTLDGALFRRLLEFLEDSFSKSDLKILVRTELNMDLEDSVNTAVGLRELAFGLINDLIRTGRLVELIRAIRSARQTKPDLVAFCDSLLLPQNGDVTPGPSNVLRKAVDAFNNGFENRIELFKYINAYKKLHDVLHRLQGFHPTIAAAVEKRKADPGQPLAEDVAFFLDDSVRIADESVQETEFPDKPPDWVHKLATAAEVLKGADLEKMPRQVERLGSLVSRGLAALNRELCDNASRLQPNELVSSLDGILNALGAVRDLAMTKLRGEVEGYRKLCLQLDELIRAHDLCQKIYNALFDEAAGLPAVTTPGELYDWEDAKKSLDELAQQRKDDTRVRRTTEAAKLFEAANQAEGFRTLVSRFNDLFLATDTALLDVTHKLPIKALTLHQALEKIQ